MLIKNPFKDSRISGQCIIYYCPRFVATQLLNTINITITLYANYSNFIYPAVYETIQNVCAMRCDKQLRSRNSLARNKATNQPRLRRVQKRFWFIQ